MRFIKILFFLSLAFLYISKFILSIKVCFINILCNIIDILLKKILLHKYVPIIKII